MNERDNGGIAHAADAAMLQVVDREAQKVGEVEEIFRHGLACVLHARPNASPRGKTAEKRKTQTGYSLYIGSDD
jgi:hypothetical protein